MKVTQAFQILTEELIESHSRCHIPYVLISGPTAIGGPIDPDAGVYIKVESEVFGRIACASAKKWKDALLALCEELTQTRSKRWKFESSKMAK